MMESCEEVEGLYDDLEGIDLGLEVEKLQKENSQLQETVQKLEQDVEGLNNTVKTLKERGDILSRNISELYKTAKAELDRKDRIISELRTQYDNVVFRRGGSEGDRKRNREELDRAVHEEKRIKVDDRRNSYKKNYDDRGRRRSRSRSRGRRSRSRSKGRRSRSRDKNRYVDDKRRNDKYDRKREDRAELVVLISNCGDTKKSGNNKEPESKPKSDFSKQDNLKKDCKERRDNEKKPEIKKNCNDKKSKLSKVVALFGEDSISNISVSENENISNEKNKSDPKEDIKVKQEKPVEVKKEKDLNESKNTVKDKKESDVEKKRKKSLDRKPTRISQRLTEKEAKQEEEKRKAEKIEEDKKAEKLENEKAAKKLEDERSIKKQEEKGTVDEKETTKIEGTKNKDNGKEEQPTKQPSSNPVAQKVEVKSDPSNLTSQPQPEKRLKISTIPISDEQYLKNSFNRNTNVIPKEVVVQVVKHRLPISDEEHVKMFNQDKNLDSEKIFKDIPALTLTDEGEIPILHLEDTTFAHTQANNNVQDKNILSLMTAMNVSCSSLGEFRSTPIKEPPADNDKKGNNEEPSFKNILKAAENEKVNFTPIGETQHFNASIENSSNCSLESTGNSSLNKSGGNNSFIKKRRRCIIKIN